MFWKKPPEKSPSAQPAKPSREELIAQAKANAAAARAEIGDETLEQIRQAMMRKEGSPMEQAKKIIKKMDKDIVRGQLSDWLKEK